MRTPSPPRRRTDTLFAKALGPREREARSIIEQRPSITVEEFERKGLAPASVVKNLTPVKALFATAVQDRKLRFNPTTDVRVNRHTRNDDEEEPR